MWILAPYAGGLGRPWIVTFQAAVVVLYMAAATCANVWKLHGTDAVVCRKTLGVTYAKERVSDLRLLRYDALILYRREVAGYAPVQPLRNRGAVLIVLDSSSRFVVLMMSKGGDIDSHQGWSGERYSDVLGLPLEYGQPIVAMNAW